MFYCEFVYWSADFIWFIWDFLHFTRQRRLGVDLVLIVQERLGLPNLRLTYRQRPIAHDIIWLWTATDANIFRLLALAPAVPVGGHLDQAMYVVCVGVNSSFLDWINAWLLLALNWFEYVVDALKTFAWTILVHEVTIGWIQIVGKVVRSRCWIRRLARLIFNSRGCGCWIRHWVFVTEWRWANTFSEV